MFSHKAIRSLAASIAAIAVALGAFGVVSARVSGTANAASFPHHVFVGTGSHRAGSGG
jgi:VIT1/CCC1 family predicted Fe2+/Mn2+ transporter